MISRRLALLAAIVPLLTLVISSQELPAGTIFPVMAHGTLDSAKAKAGEKLSFRLMQTVKLPSGEAVPAGAKLEGQIVESTAAAGTTPARVVVRVDRLAYDKTELPLRVSLRALASMQDVFNAQLPVGTFDEYGTSISDWTTVQVGGAAVYLGDETVRDGMQIVGSAPGYGIVTGKLVPAPKLGCPARDGESEREQALWVFSPWACGVYGFEQVAIAHHGNTAPVGDIELTAPKRLLVRGGSGWLLRVVSVPPDHGSIGAN